MPPTILVVDDSPFSRRTSRRVLEGLGHKVEEAVDGMTALEFYSLHRPDCVILDLVMPNMGGMEILGHLKELNPDVRVVILTSDTQRETRGKVRAAGAAGFANKPLKSAEFSAVVSKVLAGIDVWESVGDPKQLAES